MPILYPTFYTLPNNIWKIMCNLINIRHSARSMEDNSFSTHMRLIQDKRIANDKLFDEWNFAHPCYKINSLKSEESMIVSTFCVYICLN